MPSRARAIRDQVSHVEERRAIAKLFLTLLSDLRGLTGFSSYEDRAIYHAVVDATLAGQMTNASKLATVTGLPRTTVRRHLEYLIALGAVTEFHDHKLAINLAWIEHPDRIARLGEVIQAVDEICRVLGKNDESGRNGDFAPLHRSGRRA